MKKLIFTMLAAVVSLAAMAQTDFRHITYEEAVKAAKAEQKLLFLDFYTDWCGPCKMMVNTVFPQKSVGDYFNAKFVCLKVNAEKEGVALAKKHNIHAYPTFVILDSNEKEVGRHEGGNADGAAFCQTIDRIIDANKTPERMKARYEGGERSADLISAYVSWLVQQRPRRDGSGVNGEVEAVKVLKNYFAGLSDAERVKSENIFMYTNYNVTATDEIGLFLYDHRNEFAADVKSQVDELVNSKLNSTMVDYLVARIPYEANAYETQKKHVAELGLTAEYTAAMKLIECHAKGNMEAYLKLAAKEHKNLSEIQRNTYYIYFNNLFANCDSAMKMKAAKFLRSCLPDMDTSVLYWMSQPIDDLEGRQRGH